MGMAIAAERRMLTEAEREAVDRSHHPALQALPREEVLELARRLREFHDKARDTVRQRRREQRGKTERRQEAPAPEEAGVAAKKQVFAAALKRVTREIKRTEEGARDAA